MKIEINVDEKTEDTHIVISCKKLTPELQRLLAMLHILDKQLTVNPWTENLLSIRKKTCTNRILNSMSWNNSWKRAGFSGRANPAWYS